MLQKSMEEKFMLVMSGHACLHLNNNHNSKSKTLMTQRNSLN